MGEGERVERDVAGVGEVVGAGCAVGRGMWGVEWW